MHGRREAGSIRRASPSARWISASSLRISTASCCRNQKAACAGPPKAPRLEHSAIYRSTFCRFAEDWSIKRRHDFHPRAMQLAAIRRQFPSWNRNSCH